MARTKSGRKSLGDRPAAKSPPNGAWKAHLAQYAEQRILTFATAGDLDAAIDLLWTDELRDLPHETPDGKALVVPAEAVGHFRRAGLRFTDKPVRSIRELSAEEIRRLRQ